IKLYKAAPAGRMAAIAERTAQNWAKRLKEGPEWDIYEKQTNRVNRKKSRLQERHKNYIRELYDNNPFATIKDVVDDLTKVFEGFSLKSTVVGSFISNECNLSIKRVTRHPVARNSDTKLDHRIKWVQGMAKLNMSFLQNCVFTDEAGFDINMRPAYARSERNTPAVVTTPTTQAVSYTILGA
ncbi:hypothetical protein BCV72DRAFT_186131, partial [Rhizopus microsporus var. microsporus]